MRHGDGQRPSAQPHASYDSLDSFYKADPRRAGSRELDVGLWWREDVGGPLHRAAWIVETGELYLARLGPTEHGGGEIEVLATVADRARLDRALRGWRERCGERRSLGWLRARAARLDGGDRARERGAEGRPAARAGAGAGTMLAAMSSLTSELAYRSRPSARATSRSARLPASRLAPGISLPAK